MADLTIHDVPKVKEGLLRAEPSNKVARHMVEVCDIAIEQDKHIRRLTAALREAKPALHAGATALIRQAQRQRWFGDEKKAECKADAAVLRALAEMGVGDG